MSKDIEINFLTASENECIKFAEKVENEEIENSVIINTFDYFNKKEYTEKEAIILIKNIILTEHYVNEYRTDYRTYCGKTLLTAANFIEGDEDLNYKILKALFKSQYNDDELEFYDDAREEIISEIYERLKGISKKEKELDYSYQIKCEIERLLVEDKKFNIEYYPTSDSD